MNLAVERLQSASVLWRLYAALVIILLLVMALQRPIIPGAGLNFQGARAIYWSFALVGVIGYAYGLRILSQTFWRIYSLVFTADITFRSIRNLVPDYSRHGTITVLVGLSLIAAICVALLRYGGWLSAPKKVPRVRTAPKTSRLVKPDWLATSPSQRYSLGLCALASLVGALVNAAVRGALLGKTGFPLVPVEALVGFATFALGARRFANDLARTGKDTIVRGVVTGGAVGAIVSAAVALLFATALLGPMLFKEWYALLALCLIGATYGIVGGAATGATLVLLGRWKRPAAPLEDQGSPKTAEHMSVPKIESQTASFVSGVGAWAAILFVLPVALLAVTLLIPHTLEVIDRIWRHPRAPLLLPLFLLLLIVALIVLPIMTFLARRSEVAEPRLERQRRLSTTALASITFGVGLFAYAWFGGIVAAFPD